MLRRALTRRCRGARWWLAVPPTALLWGFGLGLAFTAWPTTSPPMPQVLSRPPNPITHLPLPSSTAQTLPRAGGSRSRVSGAWL
jgi:hypothetical protein